MTKKVLVIDTSILCVWLGVPRKDDCGKDDNYWDKARLDNVIKEEEQKGTTFILPLASLIETGNHIAQAKRGDRFSLAQNLADILRKATDAQSPWAAFSNLLCEKDNLKKLAEDFPTLAAQGIGVGDATIKQVADYYSLMGNTVEILTGDTGLKSYEPAKPTHIPRRKK